MSKMRVFTVIVHEAEEGGYWAECLELDCGSQGETLDEVDSNIREAIEGVLEVRLEDGDNLSAISKAPLGALEPGERRWEITVPLPEVAAV